MKLFEVFGEIKIKDDQAAADLTKINNKGKDVDKNIGKINSSISKNILKFGALGIAGALALGKIVSNSAQALDKIDKMSQRLGMSVESFQEWDYILSQAGVSIDQMQMGMKTLAQRAVEAAEGIGKGSENFRKLKINVVGANGKIKDQTVLFEETIKKLQAMESGMEKTALAQELFGRSGQELLPLLNSEAQGIDELKKKAEELGLIQSEKAVKAGVQFTDTLDSTKRMLGSLSIELGTTFMPMLEDLMNWLQQNKETVLAFTQALEIAFRVLGAAIKLIIDIIMGLAVGIEKVWIGIENAITKVTDTIKKTISSIKKDIEAFIQTIKDAIDWVKELFSFFDKNSESLNIVTSEQENARLGKSTPYGKYDRGARRTSDTNTQRNYNITVNNPVVTDRRFADQMGNQIVEILNDKGIVVQ